MAHRSGFLICLLLPGPAFHQESGIISVYSMKKKCQEKGKGQTRYRDLPTGLFCKSTDITSKFPYNHVHVQYSETSDKRHSLLRTQYKKLYIKDMFFGPLQLSYIKSLTLII